MSGWMWSELGIAETQDKRAIRRAYADRLKTLDVDGDMDAFARLRQARDVALRMAASAAPPPPSGEDASGDLPSTPYTHFGAGAEFAPDLSQGDTTTGEDDDEEGEVPILRVSFEKAGDAVDAVPESAFGAGVELRMEGEEGEAFAPEPVPDPESYPGYKLEQLLFPNGQQSDEGMTAEEFHEAETHLETLLEEARAASLSRHAQLDQGLAEMFAQAWPRSAPLVERANEEFSWLGEAGSLQERPALQFLNARIEGMRFHEAVQRNDHPMYASWKELSQPGKPGWKSRRFHKTEDIFALLTQVRTRYPEVESYLDPDRVEGWERYGSNDGPGVVGSIIRWVAIALFVVMVIGRVFGGLDRDRSSSADLRSASANLSEEDAQQIEEDFRWVLEEVLGGDIDEGLLRLRAPQLLSSMRSIYVDSRPTFTSHSQRMERVLLFTRSQILAARQEAQFDELVAINEVKRLWLQSLAQDGRLGADCPFRISGPGGLGFIDLDDAGREREQALMRQLLSAGLLDGDNRAGEMRASVPGFVIGAVIDQSGLSESIVTDALQDPNHAERCRVDLEMLNVVLAQPGRVPADLLRIL